MSRFLVASLALVLSNPTLCSADETQYVGVVGPVHGAWSINGARASFMEPVPAGAMIAAGKGSGSERSIAIYMYDGRLIKKSCSDVPSCMDTTTVDSAGGKDFVDPDIATITATMARYHVPAIEGTADESSDAGPTDGVVRLQDDGTLVVEPIFADVPGGSYRLAFTRLDPSQHFARGKPIYKTFAWSGSGVPLVNSSLSEGLYSMSVFKRGTPAREIGEPTWIFVAYKNSRAQLERFVYVSALTATWQDDEARQLFLRGYLVSIATAP